MKKAFCLFLLFFVCRSAQLLYAGTYTVDNLPMVYLQDKTKHVVNPDGILSAQTVQQMDSLLYRLETEKGVQSVVAVVERIEGGECYDFAITLGNKLGVGNRQNTGLIILLSTQDRCYQILTGEGLEGTLPDAICRRIENRRMVPYLKTGDWDTAMLQTVSAVCSVIHGDDSLLHDGSGQPTGTKGYGLMWLALAIVTGGFLISIYSNRKRNTCPRCGHSPMHRTNSQVRVDRFQGIEHHTVYYRCPKCGHTVSRSHDEPFDNGIGFGGFPPVAGPFHRGFGGGGFGGGFSGGSFGEAVSEAEEPVASSDRHTDFRSNTYFIYKEDNENKEMDDRRHSHGVHGSFKQLFIQQDGRERRSCVYSLE